MERRASRDRRAVLQALCASAALGGCRFLGQTSLDSPPRWLDTGAPRPPVIFVHGAFGARLRHTATGKEIWPIGVPELLVGSFGDLQLPLDPATAEAASDDVVADALFEEAGVVEFYGSLVSMLESAGGYRLQQAGTRPATDEPPLYAFLYDWRRDLVEAAGRLDVLVEQIRVDHGNPDLQVDIVSHSSGGLVTRYFLLYGGAPLAADGVLRPAFAGAAKARRVVAVGVPELGMARAVTALTDGEPVVMSKVGPEVLATSHTAFQLLPHGDDVWLIDIDGNPIDGDPCDPDLWRAMEMGIFNRRVRSRVREHAGGGRAGRAWLALVERGFAVRLARAQRFREALRAAPVPETVPYFSIGGECRPTRARLVIEEFLGHRETQSLPAQVRAPRAGVDYWSLMLEPGDGQVTRHSALGRPAWPSAGAKPVETARRAPWQRFVCASHNQLFVNQDCQRAMLHALADTLDDAGTTPAGASASGSLREAAAGR